MPAPIVPIWRRRPALFGAAAVVVLIAAFAAGIFVPGLSPWGGDGESSADLPSCDDTVDASWKSFLDPTIGHAVEIELDGGPLEFEVTDAHYRLFRDTDKWEIVLSTVMWNMQDTEEQEQGYWLYGPLEVSRYRFNERTCFFSAVDYVEPDQKSLAQVGFTANEKPTGLVKLHVEVDGVRGFMTLQTDVDSETS